MTRDDIVKMAHESGLVMLTDGATERQWQRLECFADLVAEANLVEMQDDHHAMETALYAFKSCSETDDDRTGAIDMDRVRDAVEVLRERGLL